MNASELTKSLAGYNSTVNDTANAIASATRPLAIIIISIFFLIEMDSWWKTMKQEGGGLTSELWMEIAFKYIIAYMLVMMTGRIFGAILEISNIAIKMINHVVPASSVDFNSELGHIKGWFIKNVITFIGGGTQFVAKLSTKLIVMMRFFQMYLLKAIGPLLVAFFVSDITRSTAINILKYFGAAAFQGVLVFIVLRLYPALVTSDLLSINMSGTWESWVTAFTSIAKGIIFIFLLWGSQRQAKSLLGVM